MDIEELTTLETLNDAFYSCAKISHWKESTQKYRISLLEKNTILQEEVRNGEYKVGDTTDFILMERGKRRDIKAPQIRDRVIQKALCQKILIPYLTKGLIYDNYASLKKRGTSFARKRLDVMLRRYIREHGDDGYVLQIDIKKYFDNVDHVILKRLVHEKINEPKEVMDLIDYVIDTSSDSDKGLNLGAEAPQIFAIFYLSGVDNYIKTIRRVKYYGRYMDDMFIISDSKEELWDILEGIKEKLSEMGLEINEKKTHISALKHGFTFMQIKYSVMNGKIIKRPTRIKLTRERRRLKKFRRKCDKGLMTEYDIHNCYKSWRGSVIKDCNACYRSIRSLDKLYADLFPENEVYRKKTRKEVIDEFLKEESHV